MLPAQLSNYQECDNCMMLFKNNLDDYDGRYVWLDILCSMLELALMFGILMVFLHTKIIPGLYSLSNQKPVVSEPDVLDGFICEINNQSYSLPLYSEDLIDLDLLDQSVVDIWDYHQDYLFEKRYKDHYQFSGVMSYENGRWYTKSLSVDLTSVQADHDVFSINSLYLNETLDLIKPDFLFQEKYSGVYKVYAANAITGFDRPDCIRMYVDRYTSVITTLEYYYNKSIKERQPMQT